MMFLSRPGLCGDGADVEGSNFAAGLIERLNLSGSLDYETYQYPKTPLFPGQYEQNQALRLVFRSEFNIGENWRAGIEPFVRYDFIESDQTAARLNEAWVEYGTDNWDLRVGNQVFAWGQMESVNRIDVLSPRDFKDDVIEPSKIGVPAIRFRWKFDNSDLSVYSLPFYIPSAFPGKDNFYGLSGGLPTDFPAEHFSSQWAARYFHAGDGYDFALSYANLIERQPIFDLNAAGTEVVSTTYRSQRLGLEFTKLFGSLIVKGEGFYRFPQTELLSNTFLYTLGLEYTFPSVIGYSDLTLFTEYFGEIGSRGQVRFQSLRNSLFTGLRWMANDQHRQELEVGSIYNFDPANTYLVRASYRVQLMDSLRFEVTYTDSFGFFVFPNLDEDGDGAFRVRLRYSF